MEAHDMVVGLDNKSVMVPLSAKRVAEEAEKESRHNAEFPMREWKRKMVETDAGMPRFLEDLITDNSNLIIHENMKTRYDEKIALRVTKP